MFTDSFTAEMFIKKANKRSHPILNIAPKHEMNQLLCLKLQLVTLLFIIER